ncbi:cAMP-dependent protein kinase catalytic subunit [Coemansia guatemalensis]|uniref:cAMP-dependent protein kinase n=1 Tax=Coemansia guatemalensis TaxID=2761395 RepID=A0A9W8LU99_9FUNG|nr:cAMP-dependent protein kinase catalytic subunit [Coemansia guatemalensis]
MAFINKILQKTKHKIGEREGSSGSGGLILEKTPLPDMDSPTNPPTMPISPATSQPHSAIGTQPPAYSTMPPQKHVVPSNAPAMQSHTSVAARAASFSVGAYSGGKGGAYVSPQALYAGHSPIGYHATPQAVPSSGQPPVASPMPVPSHHPFYGQPQQQQQQPLPEVAQQPERSYEDTHVQLNEFEIFRTVGTGSFGRVRLVRHKATGIYYAMKVLKKGHVVRAKQVEHVNSERRILAECKCPFIVYMLGTCQDRTNLYFFMEYVVGGELFTYLRRYHRFPPPVAKFYAAEVLLALEYMHARNIIWRDTKPENILLDNRGHVKLTDMGFAKKVLDRTWTLCGTPDYLAPEVIQAKGYGRSVDWWALGILIFEMIAGYPPFYDEDHYRLYEKILAGRIQWPPQFDAVSRDLVSRLLTADLSRRLGNLHRGSADIKEHRWFAEVDWDRLAAREIPAPLIPPQKVAGDTSNFDKYPETPETYGDVTSEDPYADLFVEF